MTLQTTRPRPAPPPAATRRTEPKERAPDARQKRHWAWLAAGFPFAFSVPFLLADQLDLNRDLFYGLYALAVAGFVAAWARDTRLTSRDFTRQLALGRSCSEPPPRCCWRSSSFAPKTRPLAREASVSPPRSYGGVLYGVTDGVLLSVFPILAVFAAFAGTRLRQRIAGKVLIGTIAMVASIGITASYHLGYSDFRSEKVRKPIVGDVVWSAPTLLTLSPLGAPIAHAGLHVSAVLHSYETDTFLPPHPSEQAPANP